MGLPTIVSVAEQAGLSLTWSETPKTGFLVMRLISSELTKDFGFQSGNKSKWYCWYCLSTELTAAVD